MLLTAARNLGRRRVRNFLTAAGVLIGIVTLVAMVSFGVGVQREVQRNFETVGLENIFVSPGMGQRDDFDPFVIASPETPLTPQLVAELVTLPEVVSVTPALSLPPAINISLELNDTTVPVRVSGGGASPFTFGPPVRSDMLAGAPPSDSGAGTLLARGLADSLLANGETYDSLLGREVILTVTLPRGESSSFSSQIVRAGWLCPTFNRSGHSGTEEIVIWWFDEPDRLTTRGYDQLVVRASSLGSVTAVTDYITDRGLQAQSLEAILDLANQVLSLLQALLGSVGGLALLVAALGVANTMMMAIYERTREIGVLKALGASRGQIRLMFTLEAALIGLIGGFFGLVLGTLLGRLWIGLPINTSSAKE
jgi:putative ABC transport system permease protein